VEVVMISKQTCSIIFLPIIVTFSVLWGTGSFAMHDLFKDIDENEDGTISSEEFNKDMEEYAFENIDKNDNSLISLSEWKDIRGIEDEIKHVELFEKLDKNKDWKINFFEFSDYAEKNANLHEAFMGLDKDGSNSLSPNEITVRPLFKMITIRFN
jgi:Ca2+-binding EF-hand superfamily protein